MKNKVSKRFWAVSIVITALTAFAIGYSPISANNKPAPAPVTKTVETDNQSRLITTTPLEIVASPSSFLNKSVKFQATFDKFSSLGLDYKPALRSSQDFIGILIKRDDVKDHTVPLSEMKLFLPRTEAEKYIDLNSGDIVSIEGSVFSNALGDPWIEIKKFAIIKQSAKSTVKK